jgi:hypothetical protein
MSRTVPVHKQVDSALFMIDGNRHRRCMTPICITTRTLLPTLAQQRRHARYRGLNYLPDTPTMTDTIMDLERLVKDAGGVAQFVAGFDPDAKFAAALLPVASDVLNLVERLKVNGVESKSALIAVGNSLEKIGADIKVAAAKM